MTIYALNRIVIYVGLDKSFLCIVYLLVFNHLKLNI